MISVPPGATSMAVRYEEDEIDTQLADSKSRI